MHRNCPGSAFCTSVSRPEQAWVRGVNAHLPDGVAVLVAQKVAPYFHARFDAYGRHYRYLLDLHRFVLHY